MEVLAIYTDDEYRVVLSAREFLVPKCMSSLGFQYQQAIFYPSNASKVILYPSAEILSQKGYGWRGADSAPVSAAPPTTSQRYSDALNGDSQSPGCGAEALSALDEKGLLDLQQLMFNADAEIQIQMMGDKQFEAVLLQWSACMSDLGYRFATPDDAERRGSLDGIEKSQNLAKADYLCRRRNHLEETRLELGKVLTGRWIERNPTAVSDVKAARVKVVERAKRLLNSG